MSSKLIFEDDEIRCGKRLNLMRKNGKFCDCILKCVRSQTDIHVHLAVLASSSPFFKKKIDAEFPRLIKPCKQSYPTDPAKLNEYKLSICARYQLQKLEGENPPGDATVRIIQIDGVDCSPMDNIVSYLYTGKIEMDNDNIIDMWKQATYFQLESLKEFCLKKLSTQITCDNCMDIWLLADNLDRDMENKVVCCIFENIETIIENNESVTEMSAADLNRLINQSPLLCHMQPKYLLVEKWIMADFCNRMKDFENIIKDFDFQHFCDSFVKHHVLANDTLKGSNVFLRKILERLPVIASSKSLCATSGINKCDKKLIQTGCEIYELSNDYVNVLTLRRIKWQNEYFGQTVIEKNKIFMCGGENESSPTTKTCAIYTYAINSYENVCNMNCERALNSCIYSKRHKTVVVVGGDDLPTEMYDPFKDCWTMGPEYSCKAGYYTYLAEMNGCIYAANYNSISRFDFKTNKWDYFQCYDENTWFRSILVTSENSFYAFENNRVREFDIRFKRFIPNSEFRIESKDIQGKHWLRDVTKFEGKLILLFNCGQIFSVDLSDCKRQLAVISKFPKSLTDCRPYLTSLRN